MLDEFADRANDQKSAEALASLAAVNFHYGNYEKAHALLSLANWLDADNADIRQALAAAAIEIRRPEEAADLLVDLVADENLSREHRAASWKMAAMSFAASRQFDNVRAAIRQIRRLMSG